MTVEGIISDNQIEIFPFVIYVDRYCLALSGIHNLDMSYRYHASLLDSPMLFKLGIDIYGPNFDDMKFKIGRPKYKSTDVPVFTEVIDQARINLVNSIRNIYTKGIDRAIEENAKMEVIQHHKDSIGYVNAAEQKIEEFSAVEKALILEKENIETLNTNE